MNFKTRVKYLTQRKSVVDLDNILCKAFVKKDRSLKKRYAIYKLSGQKYCQKAIGF